MEAEIDKKNHVSNDKIKVPITQDGSTYFRYPIHGKVV